MITPEPGTVVGGKYRILRALGEGGMGAVYEAENTISLKRAAIKWLHPRLIHVPDAAKRLIHEARATARVRHRNVVDIYDVVVEDGSVFLVMELLDGVQLSTFLSSDVRLVHEVVGLLLPVMHGLAAAHEVGVVHRDIKPENILLVRERDGKSMTPKLIDFGISRVFEEGERITRSGVTMGTPPYISFEQLRGARDVDHRADIFAVGVMLYETIVGRPPYDASSFGEQAISFVTTDPPLCKTLRPSVPTGLDQVVMKAVAKEREQRFASMTEFIMALEPFAHKNVYAESLAARPPRPNSVRTVSAEASNVFDGAESREGNARVAAPQRIGQSGEGIAFPARVALPAAAARRRWLIAPAMFGALVAAWLLQSGTFSPAASSKSRPAGEQLSRPAAEPLEGAAHVPPIALDAAMAAGTAARPASTPAPQLEARAPVVRERSKSRRETAHEEVLKDAGAHSATVESRSVVDTVPVGEALHRAGGMRRDEF